jgi:hypothetical protein
MKYYYLSKSRILSGLQCQKRLFLELHHPDYASVSPETEALFTTGHRVGEVARSLYPGGRLIPYHTNLNRALRETALCLKKSPEIPIFEATFSHNHVLVRTDIMVRGNNGFKLIEVKSSTSVKDYYLYDCAVQSWVIRENGYPLESVEVATIDTSFIYRGNGNYNGLFSYDDITEKIKPLSNMVPVWIKAFMLMLNRRMPAIEPGSQCTSPFHCPFLGFCNPEKNNFPVTILPERGNIITVLQEEGINDIRDIPEGRLQRPILERIRRVTITGKTEIDQSICDFLSSLPYPRYFLDFEAIQFAVPIWEGTRPYEQLPFQWSCHKISRNKQLQHVEFLDLSGNPPMRGCGELLIRTLKKQGPLFVYGSFEKSILQLLINLFPDLSVPLTGIKERCINLLTLLRQHYYHRDMRGSWSLKTVLPTVAPELNYQSLNTVQSGLEAQSAYLEAIKAETSTTQRKKIEKELREYCRMDTLGLVRLVDFFSQLIFF